MSETSSVPRPTITTAGVVIPEELDVLAGALADISAAFGGKLNTTNKGSPQYQLAQSLAAIIGDKNNQFLYFMQMIDPYFSEGRMQDALAKIYFITRNPAQSTIAAATLRGSPKTYIPVGTVAKTIGGDVFACIGAGFIGDSGTVILPFQAQEPGPLVCSAGTLTGVGQSIGGWDSITNLSDGIIGRNVESADDFEARRYASVAKNGQGSIPNVRGAVLSVNGVIDAYVTDNPTGASIVVQGVTLPAHSLYVCVEGGIDLDVAQAIQTKKSPGVSMIGNTTISVEDLTYDDEPRPTYPITFQRAIPLEITMTVSLKTNPNIPTNAITLIQQAVISAFSNVVKARIGGTVFAMRFVSVIAALGNWASEIIDIQIGTAAGAPPTKTIVARLDQIPVIGPLDIAVVFS